MTAHKQTHNHPLNYSDKITIQLICHKYVSSFLHDHVPASIVGGMSCIMLKKVQDRYWTDILLHWGKYWGEYWGGAAMTVTVDVLSCAFTDALVSKCLHELIHHTHTHTHTHTHPTPTPLHQPPPPPPTHTPPHIHTHTRAHTRARTHTHTHT